MRHYQADLFHGLSHELPIDIGHTPSVVTMHDVAFKTFPDMYQWADRKIYDAKWRFACRKATHVVAISESTKRDVQKYYQVGDDRISVIYQPVQELFYTPLSHDKTQEMLKRSIPSLPGEFLLSVGSVNSRKNLMNTLRAFADLPAENRPPLVVVGNGGHYLSECKAFADKHLSPNEVLWLHHVDSSLLLQALYTTALAMLYPSHYEGMGLPVIEALLQQCPVLTSNVSSLPEAAGPGALLVTPTDVGEISHALARLIEDSDLRQHLSTAGQAYARQKFTPALLTSQMMDLYKKITQ